MKEAELVLRSACEADIPEIETMYQNRVNYNDAHGIPQWKLEEVTWEAFSKTYTIHEYYVGEVAGVIVCGLFIVDVDTLYWPNEKPGEALYLHKICVHPEHSKKGYSDAMITFFKEKGRKEGYPEVRLDVREKKAKLRAMYERNGFQLVRCGQFKPEFTTALYHYVFPK